MEFWQRCSRVKKGASINNLPDECLHEIFSRVANSSASPPPKLCHVRGSLDNHHDVRHPLHCAVVCKRWRAAVGPAIKSLRFDITGPDAEALIRHAPQFTNLTRISIVRESLLGPATVTELLVGLAANTPQLKELILEPSHHTGLALALTNCFPAWTRLRNLTLGFSGETEEESLTLLESLEQITSLRELEVNLVETEVSPNTVCERLVELTGVSVIKMSIDDTPPPSMAALTTLKQLNLVIMDYVHSLDTLLALRSLTGLKLDLDYVPMGLPDSIGNLTALRRLVLDRCSGMGELPGSLGNLQALNHLEIDCVDLEELPASIGELRQLTCLIVRGRSIQSLPDSVSQLRELTLLALGGSSELSQLPSNIGALGNLQVLDIVNCPLQELPTSVCQLARLSRLTVSSSFLKRLPLHIGRLQALVELHLRDNSYLDILPDGMADLRSLTTLDISKCPELRRLPKRVTHLTHLEKLKIHQSAPEVQKHFLPDSAVASFQGLRELTVDAGPLVGPWLPIGLTRLTGLERLEVWRTSTEQQPQEVQGGGGILGVLGGLFKSWGDSRYSSLRALQRLQHLTLGRSSCKRLPQELLRMPALMRLTWHATLVENGLSASREVVEALRRKGCKLDIQVSR